MDKKKVIIDCDPGHDDAIALLLLGSRKDIELLGVIVESGNQTLEKTGQNAINVCEYLNINTPIVLGVSHPLIRENVTCGEIHGESGLDGFDFPKYNKTFESKNGITFLVDTLMSNNDVTIITTGPTTNIGLALRIEPKIKNHIKEIIMMGGSIDNGNVSPAAEFNILCDPEAAHIIFNSGINVKMIGLNVTRKVLVLPSIIERMGKINNRASELFVKLMKFFNKTQKEIFGYEGGPLHDPVTIVALLSDDIVTFKDTHVDIDISHGTSYGRTNCDIFDYLKLSHNAQVAIDIDVDKYWDFVETAIRSY